jgi:FkbM family methyltransferase
MKYPKYYRLKQFLLKILRLTEVRPRSGFFTILRERLYKYGWTENEGYHSQGGQDRFIDTIVLNRLEGGTYVEIGANDGLTISNTLFFEKVRKWRGCCVEPNPVQFGKLTKNRDAKCLNICVGAQNGVCSFPVISDSDASLLGRIGDKSAEGIVEIDQVDLPTLFKMLEYEHIDYLSIDTEGAEYGIVRSLERTEIRPCVIAIEQNVTAFDLDGLMVRLGYKLQAKVYTDRIYRLQPV